MSFELETRGPRKPSSEAHMRCGAWVDSRGGNVDVCVCVCMERDSPHQFTEEGPFPKAG